MMRILLLTHYFAPEAGAPQTRLATLAAHLTARGNDLTIHAPPPHYPDGIIRPQFGNKVLSRVRLPDGTRVVRSVVYATPNRGVLRRLANHASFAVSALITAPATGSQHAVVAETPPLFTAAAGVAYARLKRAPLILNVADRWPASAIELGVLTNRRAIKLAEALERWCYRRAAAITVPTEKMRSALELLPEAAGKLTVIAPAVDLDRFDPSPPVQQPPLKVLYAGTLGLAHDLEALIEAAERAGPQVVELTIVGDGARAEALRRRTVANVRILPAVDAAAVAELYFQADAGAVLLRDLPIFEEALPTKLLEVMAAGRAVVAALRGTGARLVREAGAGIVVDPGDPVALAGAFEELAADPDRVLRTGRAGRACAEQRFNRQRAVDSWERLLRSVVTSA
jgi:glycosyltransferase involved in cell wall biosynthesis